MGERPRPHRRRKRINLDLSNQDLTKPKRIVKEQQWMLIRNGEIQGIFKNRKEAVKNFKELLTQTLKDFKKQDKSNDYDYPIKIPETEFKPIYTRETYLSLL